MPHVGWNNVDFDPRNAALFAGLPAGADMYFTHSFALTAADPADVAAWTDHGGRFVAAVAQRQCRRRAVPSREVAGRPAWRCWPIS